MEITIFKYYWLDTWVLANVIQLATQDFCIRHLNHTNDPCGRLLDQMTMAARSVPANIAEGSFRHSTSRETEMKLIDVARASLSELSNDYLNWILHHESTPWSTKSPDYHAVNSIQLDRPTYKEDVLHMSGIHILAQKHKFDQWLNNEDSLITANCLIILCNRLIMMLHRQIEHLLKTFKAEGGLPRALLRNAWHTDNKKAFNPMPPNVRYVESP